MQETQVKQDFSKNLERLRNSLESFDAAKTERIGSPSVGDVVRQGDLYLVCVDSIDESAQKVSDRQLVDGTSQGSRHVVEGECTIFKGVSYKDFAPELTGPAFKCNSDCEVTHPEHGNKILPAGTSWQCIYQRCWTKNEEIIRRVQD